MTDKKSPNIFFIQLPWPGEVRKSFMYCFGLTCPAREAIEQDDDKYQEEYLQKLLRSHEAACDRCKDDYDELYATGMLNGERPDHLKR